MSDGRILQTKEDEDRKAEEKRNQVGIEFFNVNTGESRVAATAEHIAAFFNSSDQGPNAHNKQDFGWRLSPETVVELEEVKEDPTIMAQIAATYQIPIDDLVDFNVLKFIADRRFKIAARESAAQGKNYSSEYERMVAEAREKKLGSVAESSEKEDNGKGKDKDK